MFNTVHINSLPVAAGMLLGMGLLHPWLWPLVFFGAITGLYVIHKTVNAREALIAGWLMGSSKALVSLLWFWSVYPLDALGLEPGVLHVLLVVLYWVPAGLTLGLGIGIAAWLYKKYCSHFSKYKQLFLVPTLWVGAEILGATIFSIYTLGPGSSVTLGFSFGHTGYALVGVPLFRYVAMVGGVYLMSFVLAFVSYVLVVVSQKRALLCIALLLTLVTFVPPPHIDAKHQNLKVALTETNFPPYTKTDNIPLFDRQQALHDLMRYALATKSDVIILPEDGSFTHFFINETEAFSFINRVTTRDIILVDSMRVEDGESAVLRTYIYDTKTQTRYTFDKQYLVPQGEYIPWVYKGLIKVLGPEGFTDQAVTSMVYEPGMSQINLDIPEYVPPVLFCFESVTPFGVFKIKKTKTPFVAHVVSHAWFKRKPDILWHQLDAMLQTQALWNGVTITQSANQAAAKVYKPDGAIERPELIAESGYWKLYTVDL